MAPNDVPILIEADEESASPAAPNGVLRMRHNLDDHNAVGIEVSVDEDAAAVVPTSILVEPQGCHQRTGKERGGAERRGSRSSGYGKAGMGQGRFGKAGMG